MLGEEKAMEVLTVYLIIPAAILFILIWAYPDSKYPPAEPGALRYEPLKAASGSLRGPDR